MKLSNTIAVGMYEHISKMQNNEFQEFLREVNKCQCQETSSFADLKNNNRYSAAEGKELDTDTVKENKLLLPHRTSCLEYDIANIDRQTTA